MPLLPRLLETNGELDLRYSPAVRSELKAMSATGHRPLPRPGASHRPSAGQVNNRGRSVDFRSSIKIRKAGDESEPGFFEACHRRPLRADPQRRVHPDREHDRRAHGMDLHPLDPQASPTRHIISALKAAVDCLPLPVLAWTL